MKKKNLHSLNNQMAEEAKNLTKALKGDNKLVGDYGEIILRRILEMSGLEEGIAFTEQGVGLKLKDDNGKLQKPDVILHLPDERYLVIDSKMSLKSYEALVSCEVEVAKVEAEKNFIFSVKKHINELSAKSYQKTLGLNKTPDFVLLFMPIEYSFHYAIKPEFNLYQYGWERQIILVSPTTLLAILKALESTWKREKINANAQEISNRAGKIYDKFVGFIEDLNACEEQISKSLQSINGAKSKLNNGRGNLLGQVEKLKDLGAKNRKKLPEHSLS